MEKKGRIFCIKTFTERSKKLQYVAYDSVAYDTCINSKKWSHFK